MTVAKKAMKKTSMEKKIDAQLQKEAEAAKPAIAIKIIQTMDGSISWEMDADIGEVHSLYLVGLLESIKQDVLAGKGQSSK